MAESADARDLKSLGIIPVRVQIPPCPIELSLVTKKPVGNVRVQVAQWRKSMSADNGIYILESPSKDGNSKEYRVTHATAIDNITYDVPPGEFNDEQLISYFGDCKVLDRETARKLAFSTEDKILANDFCPILEYGINTIKMHRPFPTKIKAERMDIKSAVFNIKDEDKQRADS